MGATAPGSAQTIKYGHAAQEAGAAGLLVMPQTYVLKASRPELLRRFEALGKAVDLPIVAYNSPRRAGIELSVADIEALLDVAPIIGLKESHRDFFHHTHLLHRCRDRIAIMTGPSHFIFPAMALGAKGFIATGPELLGKEAGAIAGLATEKMGEAHRALHYKLTVLYEMLMGTGTWPSAFKAALNLIGQPAGVPRDPVMPLAGADLEKIHRTLDQFGLLPT
jgi:4-hydroxy-tetrahydrodipicolinate synthase